MQVEKDVIYDSAYNLAADLYVPDEANGGAIVYAHGGGWFRGDKEKGNRYAIFIFFEQAMTDALLC